MSFLANLAAFVVFAGAAAFAYRRLFNAARLIRMSEKTTS
jgi:hypothetical protein